MPVFKNLTCLRCNEEMVYLGERAYRRSDAVLFTGGERYHAFACPICTQVEHFLYLPVVVEPDEDDEAGAEYEEVLPYEGECLSCGEMIPPDRGFCPSCGWSWHIRKERLIEKPE